ncbi:multiple sugar transport system permease protein [Neobacillus niacini]|uniref:carbohydrate ABC transporter permease n=1 Tax=Neobacillus niacini TaxID=86668 RepID=UPI0027869E4B|nr:sugar ABC transporter permease [Neobacillus niacini]MDQ1004400.1 multiple sugar transport system permease protein [Neobacillus niacini]
MDNKVIKTSLPVNYVHKKTFWTNNKKEALFGWLFLLPEIIGILLLYVFPLVFSLVLSFSEWNLVGGLQAIHFAGFDNFIKLFEDEKVLLALKNNFIFTIFTVPIGMFLAIVLAVIIHTKVYMSSYFKIAFFIPYISSIIAIGAVWSALFHPSLGPINQFLVGLGIENPPMWLASPKTSIISIIIITIWAGIGYQIIIYLSSLSSIPEELYEAASIDGASQLQQFFKITLPLLGPTNVFLFITLLIGSFKVFDLIAFLTQGGPNNSSTVIVFRIYEEGFQQFNMGYASAISWLLFIIVGIITLISWKLQKRFVHS